MAPTGWGLARVVWAYGLVSFFIAAAPSIGHHALVNANGPSASNSAARRAVHRPVDRSPCGGQTETEQAMSRINTVFAAAIVFALSLTGGAALAASGGSSGGGSSGSTPVKCDKGYTYDQTKQKCEKNTSLNDQQLYQQGRALALAGDYTNALDSLNAIRNKNDAMVLTMIGYSTRKMGNYDRGLAYYAEALAIDPTNINTHEYLGEAYAEKGQLDLAKAELVKVAAVGGTTTEQYLDLAKAIAGQPDEG
jgi:tetratricopeptide (TPR) repeat protein